MWTNLAFFIAHLKVGLKGKKNKINIYPNNIIYKILDKFKEHGYILYYGPYKPRSNFIKNHKIFYNQFRYNFLKNKKRNYLISVYLKYDYLYN